MMKKIFVFLIFTVLTIFVWVNFFSSNNCAYRSPNKCYSCNELNAILVGSPDLCIKKCPNRTTNTKGSGSGNNYIYNCVLKTCPPNAPLRGMYDECIRCDDAKNFKLISNCDSCPNRYIDRNGYCNFKDGRKIEEENEDFFPKQICPKDKPLQKWNYECLPCDTPGVVQISSEYYFGKNKELEAVCPQRIIIAGAGGNPSSWLPCPAKFPLLDYNELCYSCDEKYDVDLRFNEKLCAKFCAGKRYIAEYSSNCRICPKDKSSLNQRECSECNGTFTDGKCS